MNLPKEIEVHFDGSGDNILLYTDVNDLSEKLEKRLKTVLGKTNELIRRIDKRILPERGGV